MISERLINLSLGALPLMGSPGPEPLSIAAVAAAHCLQKGFAFQLGVMAGTTSVLLLIASGLMGLILALPPPRKRSPLLVSATFYSSPVRSLRPN